jgi:hypothetical protein
VWWWGNVHAFFAEDIVSIQQNVFRIKKIKLCSLCHLFVSVLQKELKKKINFFAFCSLLPFKSEVLLSIGETVARAQYNFLIVVAGKALMLPGCVCVCVCVRVCQEA